MMRFLLVPPLAAGMFLCLPACSHDGGSVVMVDCPGGLAAAPGSQFCAADAPAVDCGLVSIADHTQVCGVALPSPTTELTRSSDVADFAGSGPPDLGCFQPAGYPTAGASTLVRVSGVAKILLDACASTDVSIELWTVKNTGGVDDGDLDVKVGTTVVTPSDCTSTTTGIAVDGVCSPRYECKYTFPPETPGVSLLPPTVPTETELVVKTYGAGWTPVYEYNVYIPDAAVTNGVWTHDVYTMASDDYDYLAQTSIGAPSTPGSGVVFGEVHDCGDVRLVGATVDVDVAREQQIFYFTSDEADPLPDPSAGETGALGLYAALGVAPGPVRVGALGLVHGKVTTVGYSPVRAFADSVTWATFSGVRPYQISP